MEGLHIPGTVNVKLMTLTAHCPDCDCRRKDSDFSPIIQIEIEKSDIFNHFFKKQVSCEGPLAYYFVRIDKIDC